MKSNSVDTSQWLTPTFTDEFSGSTLNPVWGMRGQDYEPQSKRVCSKGDPEAVDVSGGALRLSVIKDRSRSDKCKAVSRKQTKKISYRLNGHVGTDGASASATASPRPASRCRSSRASTPASGCSRSARTSRAATATRSTSSSTSATSTRRVA